MSSNPVVEVAKEAEKRHRPHNKITTLENYSKPKSARATVKTANSGSHSHLDCNMSVVGLSQSACLIITQATRLCESWLELPLLLPALELDPLPFTALALSPAFCKGGSRHLMWMVLAQDLQKLSQISNSLVWQGKINQAIDINRPGIICQGLMCVLSTRRLC